MDATNSKKTDSVKSDPPALRKRYRKLVCDYSNLQVHLAKAIDAIASGQCTSQQVSGRLEKAQENANGINEFLKSQLDPVYFNELRRSGLTIAQRVFDIPEVLELILLQTDIPNIFKMAKVSKSIRLQIDRASPRLRSHLYLPTPAAFQIQPLNFQTLFDRENSLSKALIVHKELHGIKVRFTFNKDGTIPRIGSRWLNTLVCQPPIKRMVVFRFCRLCASSEAICMLKVSTPDGFTVDHVRMCSEEAIRFRKWGCYRCARRVRAGVPFLDMDVHSITLQSWFMNPAVWEKGVMKFERNSEGVCTLVPVDGQEASKCGGAGDLKSAEKV